MKALTTALAAAFLLTSVATAKTMPLSDTARDSIAVAQKKALSRHALAVAQARGDTWRCQDKLGIERTKASTGVALLPRSIGYRRWVASTWKARAASCARAVARRVLPMTHDWATAAHVVQRVYPGTESWLLSCSDAEGGHGPWIWYGGRRWTGGHIGNDFLGMDTVGGWLQFRWSTFRPYWPMAKADAERRGFILPDLGTGFGPWLEPLGQALTGAYMRYTGRDGHHWSASHGRGC